MAEELYDRFEDLCRVMRRHDEQYCGKTAGLEYIGPPPLSLAEDFEELATLVDNDDAVVCHELAQKVRHQILAAEQREAAAKAEEARVNELTKHAEQEFREYMKKTKAELQARRGSSSQATSGGEHISKTKDVKDAIEENTLIISVPDNPFPFASLPDQAICRVLQSLPHWDVGRLSCVSRELRDLAYGDEETWEAVQVNQRRHPPFKLATWRDSFLRGLTIDASWKRRR
ncbi:hypothetical protein CYMTET_25251 [Cymbomonas tetramitiformis]|uniref:F-box domain-containing protein n=1 Tax=Cymbomonas tetramitiformis TaxID=36881 RepID=A0AAE0KZ81_9CHLO|nr:hypothetical protein CYMTET_25251 [Cymbomonas tetramitiformis]